VPVSNVSASELLRQVLCFNLLQESVSKKLFGSSNCMHFDRFA
jgi:hypothetical protein